MISQARIASKSRRRVEYDLGSGYSRVKAACKVAQNVILDAALVVLV